MSKYNAHAHCLVINSYRHVLVVSLHPFDCVQRLHTKDKRNPNRFTVVASTGKPLVPTVTITPLVPNIPLASYAYPRAVTLAFVPTTITIA